MKPTVGIVILTYNNLDDTNECIHSILNAKTRVSFEICLVDNSPTDDYFKLLKANHNTIHFIKVNQNNGYSHGNNVGINYFIQRGINCFLILNNDTIVTDYFLDGLIEHYDSNKIIAPIIYHYDDKSAIWSSGGYYQKLLANHKMSNVIDDHKKLEFLSGCCLLFGISVIDKIGLLPENFFMYSEDAEFSFLAIKNKVKLEIVLNSVLYHKVSKSSKPNSPFQYYYLIKSRFRFIYRNLKGVSLLYGVLINLAQSIYYYLKLIRRKPMEAKAVLHAISDRKIDGKHRY